MRPLEITLNDRDGCGQRRWAFVGDHDAVVARIEALVRSPAGRANAYALAIRSGEGEARYVEFMRPHGLWTDNLRWAMRWRSPCDALTWWEEHRGDDTRPVEIVHADTGGCLKLGDFLEAEGGAA